MLTGTRALPLHRLLGTEVMLSSPQPWALQHLEVFILNIVSTLDSYSCVLEGPWRATWRELVNLCLIWASGCLLDMEGELLNTTGWEMSSHAIPALGKDLRVLSWTSKLRPLPHTLHLHPQVQSRGVTGKTA